MVYSCLLESISNLLESVSVNVSFRVSQISHDTIMLAPFSFLYVLKSCYLVLFSRAKCQKKKASDEKNLLPNISTMGALQNII